jgi:hypothetical protein
MRGWLFVEPGAVAEDEDLATWIDRAESFAASLGKKPDFP